MKIRHLTDQEKFTILARLKHARQAGEQSNRNQKNAGHLIVSIRCEETLRGRERMLTALELADLRKSKQTIRKHFLAILQKMPQ